MIYSLDIETIPNHDLVDKMPEPEIKTGNLKDPEKIKEKKDEARQKQIEEMALNPLFGRVLCFAVQSDDAPFGQIIAEATDEQESALLTKLLTAFETDALRLVTWNGKEFDLPFIYKRAAILGVQHNAPSVSHWTKRYDKENHVDLMKEWDQYSPSKHTSLEIFSRFVLGQEKTDIDVTEFVTLMQTEEGRTKILNYCKQDAVLTYEGYLALVGQLF